MIDASSRCVFVSFCLMNLLLAVVFVYFWLKKTCCRSCSVVVCVDFCFLVRVCCSLIDFTYSSLAIVVVLFYLFVIYSHIRVVLKPSRLGVVVAVKEQRFGCSFTRGPSPITRG